MKDKANGDRALPTLKGDRERLKYLFRVPYWLQRGHLSTPGDDGVANEALSLLKRSPLLAEELIEEEDFLGTKTRRYPLEYFVQAGFHLPIVKEVYRLYPGVLRQESFRCGKGSINLPLLHSVCFSKTAPDDVIIFLAKKYPKALGIRTSRIMGNNPELPLQALLKPQRGKSLPSWALMKTLVDLYPESGQGRDEATGFLLLEELFSLGYKPSVLRQVAGMITKQVGCLTISSKEVFDLSLEHAKVIEKVFPQLQSIAFQQLQWTVDGFLHLLHLLSKPTESLSEIKELVLPPEILESSPEARMLFQIFLTQNKSVKTMCLSGPIWSYPNSDNFLLDTVLKGITVNPTQPLESLTLHRFQCNTSTIGAILTAPEAPKRIELSHFDATDKHWGASESHHLWHQSSITRLCLNWMALSDQVLASLLFNLSKMPHLKALEICPTSNQSRLDITEPVLNILRQNRLQSLRVDVPYGARQKCPSMLTKCNLDVSVAAVCDALKTNTSLKELMIGSIFRKNIQNQKLLGDILEHYNCSLEKVWLYGPALDRRIEYYTALNRSGRSIVRRASSTTKATVVCLLGSAIQSAGDDCPNGVLNVHFGLLREAPSLWSSSSIEPLHPTSQNNSGKQRKPCRKRTFDQM